MVNIDIRTRDDLVSQQPFTPWGEPLFYKTICDGLSFIASTGHGGFRLSQDFAERILPPELRHSDWDGYHYFEGDCEWALLLLFLRDKEPELYAAISREQFKLSKEDLDRRVNEMVEDYFIDYAHYINGRTLEYLYITVSKTASKATSYLVSCAEKLGREVGTRLRRGDNPHDSTPPVKVSNAKAYVQISDPLYADRYYEAINYFHEIARLTEIFNYRIFIRIWYDNRGSTCFCDIEIAARCLDEVLAVRNLPEEGSMT